MIKLKSILKEQKGLGDTVETITKATGIKSAVEKLTKMMGKEDCGCGARKEWLNDKIPYKK
jgi:hypothetical protein